MTSILVISDLRSSKLCDIQLIKADKQDSDVSALLWKLIHQWMLTWYFFKEQIVVFQIGRTLNRRYQNSFQVDQGVQWSMDAESCTKV